VKTRQDASVSVQPTDGARLAGSGSSRIGQEVSTIEANPNPQTWHRLHSPLDCPRDSSPLTRLRIGGVDADVCEHCGGLWLDHLELARFENPADTMGDALVAHLSQFPPPLVDHSRRLRCPRHPGAVMMRRPFSATISTQIDECPECAGLWLDTDELAAIRG